MKRTLQIEGMGCKHCAATVQNILANQNNIKKAKVNLKKNEALIVYDEEPNWDQLKADILEAGYKVID